MLRLLIILVIAILIFAFAYLASEEHKLTKAVIFSGVAAVLGFVGPYIVDYIESLEKETKETQTEEIHTEDSNEHDNNVHEIAYTKTENIHDATCLEVGNYDLVSYCECGKELGKETINIDALGHNYYMTVTNPYCDQSGYTTYICSRCLDSFVDDYTEALGHDFVDGICSRCQSISPDYEMLVIARVNEYTNNGNYDDALNLVNEALSLIESESLQQLYIKILTVQEEAASAVIFTAKPVEFITYSGAINGNDSTDVYSLTAPTSGYYHFDLSDMVNGFSVKLYVYDSTANRIGGYAGVANGRGITCRLEKDCSYSIKIMSYSGTGNYTLSIGQPKDSVNATSREVIYDEIEFIDQWNEYTFIPSLSGIYRFDVSDMVNGFTVKLFVYDSLEYKVGGYSGVRNNNGITVEMIAGETYTIKIGQYDNLGAYKLTMGKQQPIQDITGENFLSGNITYTSQQNEYFLNP